MDSSLQCLSQTKEAQQVLLLNVIPTLLLNKDSAVQCLGTTSEDLCG